MRTRIKICGLKNPEEVLACRDAGADAVGFVIYPPSPRAVSVSMAAELSRLLGPWQTPVVLFVNPDVKLVTEVVDLIPQVLLQFHGDESAGFCADFGRPYMKAVRMREPSHLLTAFDEFKSASGLLVDSWSEGYGGSGHAFDWTMLPPVDRRERPLILSGGLNASNVGRAISEIAPYGVDVSSGVEQSRGVKCMKLIKEFCLAVQTADAGRLAGSH